MSRFVMCSPPRLRRFASLITAAVTGVAVERIGEFRVRSLDQPINGWPAERCGFTIAAGGGHSHRRVHQ